MCLLRGWLPSPIRCYLRNVAVMRLKVMALSSFLSKFFDKTLTFYSRFSFKRARTHGVICGFGCQSDS